MPDQATVAVWMAVLALYAAAKLGPGLFRKGPRRPRGEGFEIDAGETGGSDADGSHHHGNATDDGGHGGNGGHDGGGGGDGGGGDGGGH